MCRSLADIQVLHSQSVLGQHRTIVSQTAADLRGVVAALAEGLRDAERATSDAVRLASMFRRCQPTSVQHVARTCKLGNLSVGGSVRFGGKSIAVTCNMQRSHSLCADLNCINPTLIS